MRHTVAEAVKPTSVVDSILYFLIIYQPVKNSMNDIKRKAKFLVKRHFSLK